MAVKLIRRFRDLLDVTFGTPSDGDVPTYDTATGKLVMAAQTGGGGGGAPTTADYLVGTAQAGLSAEIVVGTAPGGELGGTWASPTVDATHSGSSHASVQAAAEATAAAALAAHEADTTAIHGIADTAALETTAGAQAKVDAHVNDLTAAHAASAISADSTALVGVGTDVQAVLEELDNGIADHLADTADAHDASAISVADAGGYFTGTDVEAALQELGAGGGGGGGLFDAYAYLREERTNNTSSGDTVATTWTTRVLNTEVFDTAGFVTLSSNQFTLAAGTYFIRARAPHWDTGSGQYSRVRLKIRNTTDSTDAILGGVYIALENQICAHLAGRITIAGTKTFELQHWSERSQTNGFGFASNAGVTEVYAEVEIWREA